MKLYTRTQISKRSESKNGSNALSPTFDGTCNRRDILAYVSFSGRKCKLVETDTGVSITPAATIHSNAGMCIGEVMDNSPLFEPVFEGTITTPAHGFRLALV